MRRRAAAADVEVSLFSFMDIMSCVIGVIILVLGGLAINFDMAPAARAHVTTSPDANQAEAISRSLALLEQQRREMKDKRDATINQIQRLEASAEYTRAASADRQIRELNEQVAQLESERADLQANLKQVKERIEREQKDLNAPNRVWLIPAGEHPLGKQPILYLCKADGVERIPTGHTWPVKATKKPDFASASDGGYSRELTEVRNAGSSYLVFLVRPDGIGVFGVAMTLARPGGRL
jgi:hypothetical protein